MSWITGEADTGGAYSIHERIAPPGTRSVPHVHNRLAEAFYVVEGQFEFEIDGEKIDDPPGNFVRAAPGVQHAWRVAGDDSAKALVFFTPSATRAYFEELDALVAAGPVAPDALTALSEKYGWT